MFEEKLKTQMSDALCEKLGSLERVLVELAKSGKLAVAFSGGVDSAFLLAFAHDKLGDAVCAITADSAFFPRSELNFTEQFCLERGIESHLGKVGVAHDDNIMQNPPDRCYKCKRLMFEQMIAAAKDAGCSVIMDGTNTDDMHDTRPGLRALEELEVVSPLCKAGFTKQDIRGAARWMGVPVWNKPANACLATRFETGEQLRECELNAVELAENFLHELGFQQCRVRVHGGGLKLARIEVPPEEIDRLVKDDVREKVFAELKGIGFGHVSVDLCGYKMGSMNG